MSRTDKTAPWWVKKHDPRSGAVMRHDHAGGECREETVRDARAGQVSAMSRWRHERRRARFDVEVVFCAPGDLFGCYRPWACRGDGPPPGCPGHERRYVAHPDLPCQACEPVPAPTCAPAWPARYRWEVRKIHGLSPGRAAKRLGEKPRRQEARTVLRAAVRGWNAGDDDVPGPVPGRVRRWDD